MLNRLMVFGLAVATPLFCTSFNFSSFPSPSGLAAAGLTFNNPQGVSQPGGGVIQLAQQNQSSSSSVYYDTPVNISAGFDTVFDYQITGTSEADGFTFILQNSPQGTSALGGEGGSQGYQGIANTAVIDFRTFFSNSVYLADSNQDNLGNFSNHPNLTDQQEHQAELTYDGTTDILTLTFDNNPALRTSVTYNLASLLGGNTAYAGFTAGNGGLTETVDLSSWSYTDGFGGSSSPEPATVIPAALGTALLASQLRRRA